jgi:hypothetical protein
MRQARRGALAALVLVAAAYLLAAWSVPPGFFDGFAPPVPYRWGSPPPQFQRGNQSPLPGHGQAILTESGQVALENGAVSTGDNQAAISFVPGSIAAPSNHSPVTFDIKPVASYPNPGSIRLATNVYCFTSSSPVADGRDVLITLTYSTGIPAPTDIYGYQGSGPWQKIGSTGTAAPYSISAQARWLGCFAAASTQPSSSGGLSLGGNQTLPVLVAVLILLVLLAGLPLAFLRRRREAEGDDEDQEPDDDAPQHDEPPTRRPGST